MLSRVRIAFRFFFVGLAVGVLLAPRSGIETRRLLRQRADQLFNDLLEAITLSVPPATPTDGRTDGARGEKAAADEPGEPARSGSEA